MTFLTIRKISMTVTSRHRNRATIPNAVSALTSLLLGVARSYSARIPGSWYSWRGLIENSRNPRGFLEILNFRLILRVLEDFGVLWWVSRWSEISWGLACLLGCTSGVCGARIASKCLKIHDFRWYFPFLDSVVGLAVMGSQWSSLSPKTSLSQALVAMAQAQSLSPQSLSPTNLQSPIDCGAPGFDLDLVF